MTTASVESVSANGLTSGNILNLTSTSTAAAAGNTGLNIGISGANGTSSITRYGMQSAVTATGTSSTNVAGYFSASGATNNYGLIVANGNVGVGTTAPTATLDINSDTVRLRTAKTPASATAACNQGDIVWDANYVYICVATNTWKRSAIATW